MDSKVVVGGGIVVILIIAVALYSLSNSGNSSPQTTTIQTIITNPTTTVAPANNSTSNTSTTIQTTSIAPTTVGTLFNSTAHASSSYQIFPVVNLSANGKSAVSDFAQVNTPSGNSTMVTMTFKESGTSYNVTVGQGEKLYFTDTNLGDDNPSFDGNSGDDGYALVDANGYIISSKFPLPGT